MSLLLISFNYVLFGRRVSQKPFLKETYTVKNFSLNHASLKLQMEYFSVHTTASSKKHPIYKIW